MSEESDTPRPTRQAKKNAIRKIDKALPKKKMYKKKRKKEDQAAKELRQNYRRLDQERRLARQQVEQGRHLDIDWADDCRSEELRRNQKKKDEKEEIVPFECVICSEEIIDVLSKAISEGKGGVDGGLAIWSCDQKDCGVSCRREWNLGILRDQAGAYDPELLGEG
ncbi:hypothetical protein L486_06869 [Kwoniella mangroviensis CBS 10435]|uniref:Uncharacterized protein n=1 Tax=Kwoniella mangroviensis CBS 10435 TaxID=1331196 RepID=A0A1B9IIE0_9TREE|nr:hypothetical protein L486_06869 [Kwoniella mangroviensis CBS 10435]